MLSSHSSSSSRHRSSVSSSFSSSTSTSTSNSSSPRSRRRLPFRFRFTILSINNPDSLRSSSRSSLTSPAPPAPAPDALDSSFLYCLRWKRGKKRTNSGETNFHEAAYWDRDWDRTESKETTMSSASASASASSDSPISGISGFEIGGNLVKKGTRGGKSRSTVTLGGRGVGFHRKVVHFWLVQKPKTKLSVKKSSVEAREVACATTGISSHERSSLRRRRKWDIQEPRNGVGRQFQIRRVTSRIVGKGHLDLSRILGLNGRTGAQLLKTRKGEIRSVELTRIGSRLCMNSRNRGKKIRSREPFVMRLRIQAVRVRKQRQRNLRDSCPTLLVVETKKRRTEIDSERLKCKTRNLECCRRCRTPNPSPPVMLPLNSSRDCDSELCVRRRRVPVTMIDVMKVRPPSRMLQQQRGSAAGRVESLDFSPEKENDGEEEKEPTDCDESGELSQRLREIEKLRAEVDLLRESLRCQARTCSLAEEALSTVRADMKVRDLESDWLHEKLAKLEMDRSSLIEEKKRETGVSIESECPKEKRLSRIGSLKWLLEQQSEQLAETDRVNEILIASLQEKIDRLDSRNVDIEKKLVLSAKRTQEQNEASENALELQQQLHESTLTEVRSKILVERAMFEEKIRSLSDVLSSPERRASLLVSSRPGRTVRDVFVMTAHREAEIDHELIEEPKTPTRVLLSPQPRLRQPLSRDLFGLLLGILLSIVIGLWYALTHCCFCCCPSHSSRSKRRCVDPPR